MITWQRSLLGLCLFIFGCAHEQVAPPGFQIHPDFHLQQVAIEPTIMDPCQLEFDSWGHAYVLQFPGYPHGDRQSTLMRLHDDDHDGIYERSTLFADSLNMASSFTTWRDGFLVAAVPDLIYLEDTNDDHSADIRQVIISGFEVGNQQHNVNGLIYTLDNCLLLANGYNGGAPYWADAPESPFAMGNQDLKLDVRGHKMQLLGKTSGGHEIALDDFGRAFMTHNTDYLQHLVFSGNYLPEGPTDPPHALENIGQYETNGLGRIYPIGEQESRVNHPEQAGHFSGACGIFHYGGSLFPAEFQGNVFVADVVTNLIHRNQLVEHGSSFRGKRVRPNIEFLASEDRSFRPVTINSGPDGAMYIVDMHREVIEHPEWIPDQLEKDLDLLAGDDQGRIYRISPKESHNVAAFRDFEQLNAKPHLFLGHANQWVRMTAQRLVVDQKEMIPLEHLQESTRSENDLEALHALWSLQGLELLKAADISPILKHTNPSLVENAVQLCEYVEASPELQADLVNLLQHPHPRVRMQAILTIGRQNRPDLAIAILHKQISKDASDPYLRLAIQTLPMTTRQAVLVWSTQQDEVPGAGISKLTSALVHQNMQENSQLVLRNLVDARSAQLPAVLEGVQRYLANRPQVSMLLRNQIADLLTRCDGANEQLLVRAAQMRSSLGLRPSTVQRDLVNNSERIVLDADEDLERRLLHLDLISYTQEDLLPFYSRLMSAAFPSALQSKVIEHLSRETSKRVPDLLLKHWAELGPSARLDAGNLLLYTSQYQRDLLGAFERQQISLGEMNMHLERRRTLLFSDDPEIRTRAEALFDDSGILSRAEAIEDMRPALELSGEAAPGLKVFDRLCGQCHTMGIHGVEVGPTLAGSTHKSKLALLHDILDPNAGCENQYLDHAVECTDGNTYHGVIATEDAQSITLKLQGGFTKRILRSDIIRLHTTGRSLMPEGLEASMSHQEMADLIKFLQG